MGTYDLKSCMQEFSLTQLEEFLGENLVDTLIEWVQDNENVRSKSRIVDMIMTIKGLDILKNKKFRELILSKIKCKDLLYFNNLLNKNEQSDDLKELCRVISNKSFGRNNITFHILELFGISEELIFIEEDDIAATEKIEPYDRFYELLDYQFVIKQKILSIINSNIRLPRLLVHMPTGTGKTKTSAHTLIHHYNFNLNKKGAIIWLAHTTELLEQACETLQKTWMHLGMGELNLHRLWGNLNPLIDMDAPINGFVICGFQKMISLMKNNPDLFNKLCLDCRLVVVDEAHKATADETKKLINALMIKKADMEDRALIGLTATPGRDIVDDLENKRLVNMFESRIISIDIDVLDKMTLDKFDFKNSSKEKDIIKYLQGRRILAKLKREKLTYDYSFSDMEIEKIRNQALSNGLDFSDDVLRIIGMNKQRNLKILNKLIELEFKKIPTIVFACSVEHGKLLSSFLTLRGIKNACVFGEMNPTLRQEYIRRFKDRNDDLNVLINYEVLTTGFDATNIRCVFITRPTKSIVLYSQMLGRGLRGPLMGGNEECLLIDIEDNLNAYTDESMAFNYFNNYWNN